MVGIGERGLALLRALDEAGALAAAGDIDPAARQRAAAHRPDLHVEGDYLALLNDPGLQAVVLATPPPAREEMARAALQAGKDVLVPGLPAPTARAAEALEGLARQAGRVLMAGPLLRFDPAARAVREAVRAGTIGPLRSLHAEYLDRPASRPAGGPIWSLAPGWIDLVLDLAGEMPDQVRAVAGAVRGDTVEAAVTHLAFPSGLRAHVHVSWVHPFPVRRLTVVGEAGTIVLEDGRVRWFGPEGDPVDLTPNGPDAPASAARRFVDAVRERAAGEAAAGAPLLRVLEAAARSLDEGRVVPGAAKEAPVPETPAPRPNVRIHPTAIIDGDVDIGEGTSIWHFSKVLGPATIGRGCTLGQNVVVERNVRIGDNVKIQNNVSVYSGVILEDDVFCGPSMVFTNVGTPRSAHPRRGQYQTTLVKRGASIGANATVVCGRTLGRYAFVGAGAVVTRDVPDYGLVYGNPARLRGWACFCGATLPMGIDEGVSEQATCGECGRRYLREGLQVREVDGAEAR